jgi:ATP-dependent DNA helicase RecG
MVLVGVSDSGQVAGVEIQAKTLQGGVNQCKQNTSPSVIPDIEVVVLDGKTVAVISVDEYPTHRKIRQWRASCNRNLCWLRLA